MNQVSDLFKNGIHMKLLLRVISLLLSILPKTRGEQGYSSIKGQLDSISHGLFVISCRVSEMSILLLIGAFSWLMLACRGSDDRNG